MLAKYEFEEVAASSPWAEQFCQDLISLDDLDGVQMLVTQVKHFAEKKGGRALKILIQNLECRNEFLNFDIKRYKQREKSGSRHISFHMLTIRRRRQKQAHSR